jgi:hypothetical protein
MMKILFDEFMRSDRMGSMPKCANAGSMMWLNTSSVGVRTDRRSLFTDWANYEALHSSGLRWRGDELGKWSICKSLTSGFHYENGGFDFRAINKFE